MSLLICSLHSSLFLLKEDNMFSKVKLAINAVSELPTINISQLPTSTSFNPQPSTSDAPEIFEMVHKLSPLLKTNSTQLL